MELGQVDFRPATRLNQSVIKQKKVAEELKEQAEAEADYTGNPQVFLPEETSWRIQTHKLTSGITYILSFLNPHWISM